MKNVLNEISRIKNLMLIKEDENSFDGTSGTVIIGDNFAELVSDEIRTIPYLVDENMTVNLLIKKLSSSEVFNEVNNVILSIGTVDLFNGLNQINFLCDLITQVFPNANHYVFKGVISNFDIKEDDLESIEETADVFYDEFVVCGFDVVGNYPVVSDVPVDLTNPAIQDLIEVANEMPEGDFEDISDKSEYKKMIAKRNVNDEDTDFDSIYEFLDQFEKIYRSKQTYDSSLSDMFEYDIKQIQIVLNFLLKTDLEVNGVYDQDTEDAVAEFQYKMKLEETGVCDTETLEEMFYELKVKGFDEEDLSMFIKGDDMGDTIQGILDISKAGLSSEQRSNVERMIEYMEDAGITNPYAQLGILSVIGKESGFVPKNEVGYGGTSDERIESVFGARGTRCKALKHDDAKFFDCVYGPTAKADLGWDTGNDNVGDGYKYIGRGFNQITFKNNYRKYGDAVGIDLVSDPEKLNDVDVAAEAAVAFLTKGGSIPDFKSKEEATNHFLDVNAGGRNGRSESRQKAFEWMNKFEVK